MKPATLFRFAGAVLAMALTGLMMSACGPRPPDPALGVRTVEVRVPVPAPCDPDLGPDPAYPDPDSVLRRLPGETVDQHLGRVIGPLLAGRKLRDQRLREQGAALAACRAPALPDAASRRPGG